MKVSVALCTYNGARYIKQQIDSILRQTVPVDEIVICDDCSSDETIRILEAYRHPKIRIHENEANMGYVRNFAKAYDLCTGDVVFFSDQDDEWHIEKVEKMILFFDQDTCNGVFSDGTLMDSDAQQLGSTLFKSSYFDQYVQGGVDRANLFSVLVLGNNCVTGATLAVRKGSVVAFEGTTLSHDQLISIDLAAKGELFFTSEKLIKYRLHGNQCLGVRVDPLPYYINNYALYTLDDVELSLSLYKHFIKRLRFFIRLQIECDLDFESSCAREYVRRIKTIDRRFREAFLRTPQGLDYVFLTARRYLMNDLLYRLMLVGKKALR